MLNRDRKALRSDVLWGIRSGLLMALACGIVALGSLSLSSDSSSRNLVFRAIALYPIGGLIAGALLGFMRPLLKWHFVAMVVGAVALIPAAIVFSIPFAREQGLIMSKAIGAAVMTGTMFGAAIGHWLHVDSGADG